MIRLLHGEKVQGDCHRLHVRLSTLAEETGRDHCDVAILDRSPGGVPFIVRVAAARKVCSRRTVSAFPRERSVTRWAYGVGSPSISTQVGGSWAAAILADARTERR